MPYTWPATIPLPTPQFSGEASSNILRDTLQSGPISQSPINNVVANVYSLTWRLTDDERNIWLDAFKNGAINGNDWVDMPLPLRGTTETFRVRFSSAGFEEQYTTFFDWSISANVEIFDLELLDSDEIDAIIGPWTGDWPVGFLPLSQSEINSTRQFAHTRTLFGSNISRQRRRFTDGIQTYELVWHLTEEERLLWFSIYQNKLDNGTDGFNLGLPSNGTIANEQVRFVGQYQQSNLIPNFWAVSATVETYFPSIIVPE